MSRALPVLFAAFLLPTSAWAHDETEAPSCPATSAGTDAQPAAVSSSEPGRPGFRTMLAPVLLAPAAIAVTTVGVVLATAGVAAAGVTIAGVIGAMNMQKQQGTVAAPPWWIGAVILGAGAAVTVPAVLALGVHAVTTVKVAFLSSLLGRAIDGVHFSRGPVRIRAGKHEGGCGACPFGAVPPPCSRGGAEIHTAFRGMSLTASAG